MAKIHKSLQDDFFILKDQQDLEKKRFNSVRVTNAWMLRNDLLTGKELCFNAFIPVQVRRLLALRLLLSRCVVGFEPNASVMDTPHGIFIKKESDDRVLWTPRSVVLDASNTRHVCSLTSDAAVLISKVMKHVPSRDVLYWISRV